MKVKDIMSDEVVVIQDTDQVAYARNLMLKHGFSRLVVIDSKGVPVGIVTEKDIARKLEVSRPSVSEMVRKLSEDKFIQYERYGGIIITPKGKRLAQEIKKRHNLLVNFLRIIGVDEDNAQKDACKLEHDISPETMDCLIKFVEYVNLLPTKKKKG